MESGTLGCNREESRGTLPTRGEAGKGGLRCNLMDFYPTMYIYRFLLCNLIDLLNWWWSGVFIPNYGAQNQSVFTLLSLFELSKINLKSFPFFLISTSSFLSSRQLCNEPLTQRYWYLVSVFFSFVHLYSYDSDPVFLLPALFKGCAKSFGSVIPVHLFLSSSVMLSIFVILQKPPHAIYHRLFLSTCRFFPFLIFHLLPYFIDHASFDRSFVVSSTEAFTLPTFVRFYLSPSPNAPLAYKRTNCLCGIFSTQHRCKIMEFQHIFLSRRGLHWARKLLFGPARFRLVL